MRAQILCAIAIVGLLSGCAWTGSKVGASAYNDHDVLTGGPVSGITLKDLPQAVKDTLKQKAPTAEVSDIQREIMGGKTVYKFTFLDPSKNPSIWIEDNGNEISPGQ